jgi:tetratricopeptide (TPR) repeat protein
MHDLDDAEPTQIQALGDPKAVQKQRDLARNLMVEGQFARACAELLKAVQLAPVTIDLARELARAAYEASLENVAASTLEEAWTKAFPADRPPLHRLLARLARRSNQPGLARRHLYLLLAENPSDRRAQIALSFALTREARPQELERVLDRFAHSEQAQGRARTAARVLIERGRTLAELLDRRKEAATSFSRAAEEYALAKMWDRAYVGRALAAATAVSGRLSRQIIHDALQMLLQAGKACGKGPEALALADALDQGGTEPAPYLASLAAQTERKGFRAGAVALWEVTIEAEPTAIAWPEQLVRLFSTERSWFDLAEHYRRCAARPAIQGLTGMRATWLTHRAELLEDRLGDFAGAAAARVEAFALSGDRTALRAQLALLERYSGAQAANTSLDRTVASAGQPLIKAAALQVRAERHAAARRFGLAVADLHRAAVLGPLDADGLRLLGECRAEEGEADAISELWKAAEAAPRGKDRGERFRKLAKLSLWPLGDPVRSLKAWGEVFENLPGDPEAEERLVQAAHVHNRPSDLVPILKGRIARAQRGPEARQARHELARLYERLHRDDEALAAWVEAVRAEPGDASAQLALADRLEQRGRYDEAALSLEGAAQALDDPSARAQTWSRLARFYRDVLNLPERAATCEQRAEALGSSNLTPLPHRALPPLRSDATTPTNVLAPKPEDFPLPPLPPLPPRRPASSPASSPALPSAPASSSTSSRPLSAPVLPSAAGPSSSSSRPLSSPALAPASRMGPASLPPSSSISARPPSAPPMLRPVSHSIPPVPSTSARAGSIPLPPKEPPQPSASVPVLAPVKPNQVVSSTAPTDEHPSLSLMKTIKELPPTEEPVDMTPTPTPMSMTPTPMPTMTPTPTPSSSKHDHDDERSSSGSLKRESTNTRRRKRSRTIEPHRIPLSRAVPTELYEALDRNPLSADVHRKAADHCERKGDVLRASLFTEVARAIEGDPDAQPRAPKGTLSVAELAALRHSELKSPVVEALSLCSEALCAQAAKSKRAEPFSLSSGKGAHSAAQALLDVVRLMGQRAPDVVLASEEGPPFLLQNTDPVRLAVGKMAVRKELAAAELRFYAGRALSALAPDLLALRLLDASQLEAGLKRAREALVPDHLPLLAPPALKALVAWVGTRQRERFVELAPELDKAKPDWERLISVARYTTNRAGLVAAGGVAPALQALQTKRAGKEELAELVRFAISDRHVRIRSAAR